MGPAKAVGYGLYSSLNQYELRFFWGVWPQVSPANQLRSSIEINHVHVGQDLKGGKTVMFVLAKTLNVVKHSLMSFKITTYPRLKSETFG